MSDSRQQFEHWYLSALGGERDDLERHPLLTDEYGFIYVQTAWKAWQTSRACLEVELPSKQYMGSFINGSAMYVYWVEDVIAALEAAGIKVKP